MSLTSLGSEAIARRLYRSDNLCRAVSRPECFTDQHVREFHENGFVAIENVFAPLDIEGAIQGIHDLIGGKNSRFNSIEFEAVTEKKSLAPAEREPYVRAISYFIDYDERLRRLSVDQGFIAIVERLIGMKVRLIQDMALLKPPHLGREKPWHQDSAYFLLDPPDQIIGARIALDEATVENGCMHVIPGSHRFGPRPHYHDRDCQLPDETVDIERDLVVPLRPGGALFFSSLLHHGTPPNRSASRRWAIQFHFASTNCREIDADRHAAYFRDCVGYAGCTSWKPNGKPERAIETRA